MTAMSDFLKILIAVVTLIGAGLAWAVSNFVTASSFDAHLTAEERRYVLDLKADLRQIDKDIDDNPGDQGLIDDREELLDELCELRPSDRLCR